MARRGANGSLIVGLLRRRAEAWTLATEAAGLYRDLARGDPGRYLPDLASALTNLDNQLAELGQHREALDRMREGVEVRRTLAARQPGGRGPAGLELASTWPSGCSATPSTCPAGRPGTTPGMSIAPARSFRPRSPSVSTGSPPGRTPRRGRR